MSELFVSLQGNDRKKVKVILGEMSISLTRMEAERDHMKDMIERLKKEFEIPPKLARKAAKVYHAQLYNAVRADADAFDDFYSDVFGPQED